MTRLALYAVVVGILLAVVVWSFAAAAECYSSLRAGGTSPSGALVACYG